MFALRSMAIIASVATPGMQVLLALQILLCMAAFDDGGFGDVDHVQLRQSMTSIRSAHNFIFRQRT